MIDATKGYIGVHPTTDRLVDSILYNGKNSRVVFSFLKGHKDLIVVENGILLARDWNYHNHYQIVEHNSYLYFYDGAICLSTTALKEAVSQPSLAYYPMPTSFSGIHWGLTIPVLGWNSDQIVKLLGEGRFNPATLSLIQDTFTVPVNKGDYVTIFSDGHTGWETKRVMETKFIVAPDTTKIVKAENPDKHIYQRAVLFSDISDLPALVALIGIENVGFKQGCVAYDPWNKGNPNDTLTEPHWIVDEGEGSFCRYTHATVTCKYIKKHESKLKPHTPTMNTLTPRLLDKFFKEELGWPKEGRVAGWVGGPFFGPVVSNGRHPEDMYRKSYMSTSGLGAISAAQYLTDIGCLPSGEYIIRKDEEVTSNGRIAKSF